MTDAWILTYTGRQFWPLSPRAEDVCIEDIAHALSNICRFNGHVRQFYSVAQHCVSASQHVHERYALEALMHDASEAYLCDLPRPLKRATSMHGYGTAEKYLEAVIALVFNLKLEEMGCVRAVDEKLLLTERRDLMPTGHWITDETQCFEWHVDPWSPASSEKAFLQRFKELTA